MKLISWNCQGAFRKKAGLLLKFRPDILVIQECEHPDKLFFSAKDQLPDSFIWYGDNLHKGLGVFSYNSYKLKLLDQHNPDYKIILPISVFKGRIEFTLFAIWANNPEDKNNRYVEQIWKAINHYDQLLNNSNTILTGDFNSNKIWDKKRREGNHSTVVEKLACKKIYSVYHQHFNQNQGEETQPTFYLQRNKKKTYHIDYCFSSANIFEKLQSIEIGAYKKWIAHSDHSPIIVNFDL